MLITCAQPVPHDINVFHPALLLALLIVAGQTNPSDSGATNDTPHDITDPPLQDLPRSPSAASAGCLPTSGIGHWRAPLGSSMSPPTTWSPLPRSPSAPLPTSPAHLSITPLESPPPSPGHPGSQPSSPEIPLQLVTRRDRTPSPALGEASGSHRHLHAPNSTTIPGEHHDQTSPSRAPPTQPRSSRGSAPQTQPRCVHCAADNAARHLAATYAITDEEVSNHMMAS